MTKACAPPPDARFIHHSPVVGCADAARARGVATAAELKTLILEVGHTVVAVHTRGDLKVRIRSVKRLFGARDIRLASIGLLGRYGLAPGLINPWNVPFCRYHLLCMSVLANDTIATNSGSLTSGMLFNSTALLDLPNLIVGFFGDDNA